MTQVVRMSEQQMYVARLIGYDYTIQYCFGSSNVVVDALLRIPEIVLGTLLSLSVPCFTFLEELKWQLCTDPNFITMWQAISVNSATYQKHKLTQYLILHKGRIWLPNTSPFISTLLAEFHFSPVGGHMGVTKTMARISENFIWPGIRKDVEQFIATCLLHVRISYVWTPLSLSCASSTMERSFVGLYCWATIVS